MPTIDSPDRPKLLHRLRNELRARHYSPRTEQAYVLWTRLFPRFHGMRHPGDMGEEEVNRFVTHLAVERHVSPSTQTQALSAILFLYRYVLGRQLGDLGSLVRARKQRRLPVVLSRDEVRAVLGHLTGDTWLMGSLMYGSGLRISECLALRVQHLDLERRTILVRDGKGSKDRSTMLPGGLVEPMAEHLEAVREIHRGDLAQGFGRVALSHALTRKYPAAPTEWGWQWIFPLSG